MSKYTALLLAGSRPGGDPFAARYGASMKALIPIAGEPMVLRPFQRPHPPLWYGLGHLPGAEWAAAHGVNVIANAPAEGTRPLLDRYREVWAKAQGEAPPAWTAIE